MQITVQFKILPTKEQAELIDATMKEYINAVNSVVSDYVLADKNLKYSSKNVVAELPSALKAQVTLDAKSVFNKYTKAVKLNEKKKPEDQKEIKVPVLRKPVAIWNNQNWKLENELLQFPIWVNKSQRLKICSVIDAYQLDLLTEKKLGTLRITKKNDKYIAQIAVLIAEEKNNGENILGVDLGLKVPAVAATNQGKTKFLGNGRQNKFIRRKYKKLRRKLGKAKKLKTLKKINNKEQRWMRNQDHQISREIINFAKQNNVAVIRLEELTNIRNTARTSRKNAKNLHNWSFYRLACFIEYKAIIAGIRIEYVNPKYTSQICPSCGNKNKANDRKYQCSCGFKTHRDRVGAINILTAPVTDGNSLSA